MVAGKETGDKVRVGSCAVTLYYYILQTLGNGGVFLLLLRTLTNKMLGRTVDCLEPAKTVACWQLRFPTRPCTMER